MSLPLGISDHSLIYATLKLADRLVKHAFIDNKLFTDNQWAYRKGHSTELMLAHLTETWRLAVDNKLVVGIAFVDFQKAFDCVPHKILIYNITSE